MHLPVMLQETLERMAIRPGGVYIDATLGGAGHAEAILERSAPDGRLLGLDRDPEAIRRARVRLAGFGERFVAAHTPFSRLAATAGAVLGREVDGVLMDVGVSSFQLDDPARGFSFRFDAPLDMRMDPGHPRSAADLVNGLPEADLVDLIRRYGEEPGARRVVAAIVARRRERPIRTTAELAATVEQALGGRRGRLHPATRTFQALRMAVNEELPSLQRFLDSFVDALRPGGRLVVIAFHSLEDRAVKQSLRRLAHPCTCPPGLPVCACGRRPVVLEVTHRPLRPRPEELAVNARARSARLRAAERA
jgi:16S rRNA (cytosine1402-N4)-methyltransferase